MADRPPPLPAAAPAPGAVRVSVVIPAFEAGALLGETLATVAAQQGFTLGHDLEAIVANDGAQRPDSLAALAAARAMAGVTVVDTPGRTGPAAARNTAARTARGEWIAFLDADDRLAPDALARRLAAAAAFPAAGCVATDYAEFPDGEPFKPSTLTGAVAATPFRRAPVQAAYDARQAAAFDRPLATMVSAMPLWTGAVTVRRAVFERLGGFPAGHNIGEDLHLWLRIAASEQLVFLPEVTAYWRRGHPSLTALESRMSLKSARCFEALLPDPLTAPVRRRLERMIGEAYASESYLARTRREPAEAWRMARLAWRWQPGSTLAWRALLLAPWPARG